MLKKLLLSGLLLAMCASPAFAQNIKAAFSDDWPPLEFYNEQGAMDGFSIDYAQALARHMGVEIEMLEVAWSEVFTDLLEHKFDIIISSVSITPERASMCSFSRPYMSVRQALLVKTGAMPLRLDNLQNKRIGVYEYTTSHYLGKSSGARVSYFTKLHEALQAMLDGKVDAVLCDSPVAYYYMNINPQYKGRVELSDLSDEKEYYGIALRQDDKQLLDKLNQAITALQNNGTFTELAIKWMGNSLD